MNQSFLGFLLHALRGTRATDRPWTLGCHARLNPFPANRSFTRIRSNILSAQATITATSVVLTNTHWSKLWRNQRTGAELVIGRNWSPVEESIGTSRLERGGSRGGSRGRGAGAHGRLRGTGMVSITLLKHEKATIDIFRFVRRCTWTMAGSWGKEHVGLGGSHTVKSLMSLPLKIMYSKVSSRGGMGLSVGLSSVPKERTNREEAGHS